MVGTRYGRTTAPPPPPKRTSLAKTKRGISPNTHGRAIAKALSPSPSQSPQPSTAEATLAKALSRQTARQKRRVRIYKPSSLEILEPPAEGEKRKSISNPELSQPISKKKKQDVQRSKRAAEKRTGKAKIKDVSGSEASVKKKIISPPKQAKSSRKSLLSHSPANQATKKKSQRAQENSVQENRKGSPPKGSPESPSRARCQAASSVRKVPKEPESPKPSPSTTGRLKQRAISSPEKVPTQSSESHPVTKSPHTSCRTNRQAASLGSPLCPERLFDVIDDETKTASINFLGAKVNNVAEPSVEKDSDDSHEGNGEDKVAEPDIRTTVLDLTNDPDPPQLTPQAVNQEVRTQGLTAAAYPPVHPYFAAHFFAFPYATVPFPHPPALAPYPSWPHPAPPNPSPTVNITVNHNYHYHDHNH